MTTKASTTKKRSRRSATASKVNRNSTTLEIQNLPIGKIKADLKQPRKTFDEKMLVQLSDSIKEHGVLQPITVRKSRKDFIIVMGERRYRASKMAEKKTIPAIVRDYRNSEILEVQIIENLQRQDVEPTEEAEAIAFLTEKYAPSEIAKRLGRTDNFVKQRLKLAVLIDGFKHFVRKGEMTISLGVAVALFEPEEQLLMLETMGEEFNAHQINRMINNRTYSLENAPFDVNNEKLLPKAGACDTCPFNAANQGNLFGEGKMVCTKTPCFEAKKNNAFVQLMEDAKKNSVLLIPEIRQYWADDEGNQFVISQLEQNGFKIYLLDDVEIIEEPIEPTLESIKHEYRHYENTDEELNEFLDEAKKQYAEDLEAYTLAKENGFMAGIVFHPETYVNKNVYVKVIEKSKNESTSHSAPLEKRKMADCTSQEQIVKMEQLEIRKKQIENNKQFEEVVAMIRETDYVDTKKTLSIDEMVAFSISLFENNVDYVASQKYFSKFLNGTSKMTPVETVAHFRKNFKKEVFLKLIRYILTKQVHFGESNHINNLTNISFYNAMQGYYKSKIVDIEKDYAERRTKREARLKERIAVLEKKIQELND